MLLFNVEKVLKPPVSRGHDKYAQNILFHIVGTTGETGFKEEEEDKTRVVTTQTHCPTHSA